MSMVEIRTAREHDVPRLGDIFRSASWSNEGDRAVFAEHPEVLEFRPDTVAAGRTRLAVLDGQVVGFATVRDTSDGLELDDLFVDPEYMRRGVARELIADAVRDAARRGVARIDVDANDHARAFYEAVGFVGHGRVSLDHGVAERMTLNIT